jgi:exodeoxyribonuclease V alpha subunit
LTLEYLSSRLISGVGSRTAQRIVGAFGAETAAIITFSPERLTEVSGIGEATARRIAEMWRANAALPTATAAARRHAGSSRVVLARFQRDGEDGLRRLIAEPATIAAEAERAR